MVTKVMFPTEEVPIKFPATSPVLQWGADGIMFYDSPFEVTLTALIR